MMRSFHYAAHSALSQQVTIRPEDIALVEPWGERWAQFVSAAFLQSYLQTAGSATFIPDNRDDVETLIEAFLLEKAIYEVGYELNNRPTWAPIPIRGIQNILREREAVGVTATTTTTAAASHGISSL